MCMLGIKMWIKFYCAKIILNKEITKYNKMWNINNKFFSLSKDNYKSSKTIAF